MSTQKQLSFQNGEISPFLKYKSDEVSYGTGLGKLRNMFVRRTGGVSNRAGFEFVRKSDFQYDIPSPGGPAGVKAFTFWSPENNAYATIQYGRLLDSNSNVAYAIRYNTTTLGTLTYNLAQPSPSQVKFTALKDYVYITPEMKKIAFGTTSTTNNLAVKTDGTVLTTAFTDPFSPASTGINITNTGVGYTAVADSAALPATFFFTAIMRDGREIPFYTIASKYDPTTWTATSFGGAAFATYFPFLAGGPVTCTVILTLSTPLPTEISQVCMYRASGSRVRPSQPDSDKYLIDYNNYYKLVVKQPYDGTDKINFSDYGAEDATVTPPTDATMFDGAIFHGVECAAYYQQRLICGMRPGVTKAIKTGDMIASKIGAPRQIAAPLIYNNTGAFQFSVPITDGTPVIALLAMERLMAFTERAVYAVRGGDQGVLTPTSVNPLAVSEEGCSKVVEPKMSGKVGYFINNAHTKLMGIRFSIDGNMEIFDASVFSEHLINGEDIVQLEVLNTNENIVYLLRRDGKIVTVTLVDGGSQGFALLETSGYVESIYRGKAKRPYPLNTSDVLAEKYYDVLMAYVIRNGQRNLERLAYREDRYREGEFFADCYTSFGMRLSLDSTSDGFKKLDTTGAEAFYVKKAIVKTTVTNTWTAGTPLEIWYANPDGYALANYASPNIVFHFFYFDTKGNKQTVEFVGPSPGSFTPGSTGDADFPLKISVVSDQAVPAYLQDVKSQTGLTADQKARRYTRWLPAFNSVQLATTGSLNSGYALGLANAPVAVVMDGDVLSSPLNPSGPQITTVYAPNAHTINLPRYACFGYVGIPYQSEFETLDLEVGGARTLMGARKNLNKVGVGLYNTRGGYYGIEGRPLSQMQEFKKQDDLDISVQAPNVSDYQEMDIESTYTRPGRINIKQVDPAPMSILAVYPMGVAGD